MKAVLIAVSLFLPFSFSIASAQLTKVTVGYSAVAAGQLPAWMAKESGIFRKNGVDVQLVYFRGGNNDGLVSTGDPNKSGGWPGDREC
jgi:ABC-type nitrate/sulfonate/bicarbonate transport system substrate-binding protein